MGTGLEHQPPHPGAEFGTKDPFARIGEQHLLDLLADMPHRYVTEARTGASSPIFRKTRNPCQILGHHGGVCLMFTRKQS